MLIKTYKTHRYLEVLITRGGQTCRERLVNLKKIIKWNSQTDQMCAPPAAEVSWKLWPRAGRAHCHLHSNHGWPWEAFSPLGGAHSALLVQEPILVNSNKNEKPDSYYFPCPLSTYALGHYIPWSTLALVFSFFFLLFFFFLSNINYFYFC